MLWVAEHIYLCGRKKEHFVWSICTFSPPSPLPTLHCLSVWWMPLCLGAWGFMAGLSGFASHRCSLHLATNSGSSRMSQIPNLHIAMQLLININFASHNLIPNCIRYFGHKFQGQPRGVHCNVTLLKIYFPVSVSSTALKQYLKYWANFFLLMDLGQLTINKFTYKELVSKIGEYTRFLGIKQICNCYWHIKELWLEKP